MAGPELTPEQLAQLEAIGGQPYDCSWHEDYVQDCDESTICDARDANKATMIAAVLNAVPALVAAAKERDQLREDNMKLTSEGERTRVYQAEEIGKLRAEIDRYQTLVMEVMRERDEAREEVARLRFTAPVLPISASAEEMVDGMMREATSAEIELRMGVTTRRKP